MVPTHYTGWLVIVLYVLMSSYQEVSGLYGLTETDRRLILARHNLHRRNVRPVAADMLEAIWQAELADLAQEIALNCSYGDVDTAPLSIRANVSYDIGVNLAVHQQDHHVVNYVQLINEWNSERQFYDYSLADCNPLCTCEKYLQLVWASSCYVGCGVAHCETVTGFQETNAVLFVCLYGPAGVIEDMLPYTAGSACSLCPPDRQTCNDGLCAPNQMMMMGSDPHFSVLLPCGHMLCFSVQGEDGRMFNLLSNDMVEINALFIPDPMGKSNTWIGSIGVYILGKSFTFDLSNEKIFIGEKLSLDAYSISSISMFDGHFLIRERKPTSHPRHNVDVDLQDVGLRFTVSFVKKHHLDLFWHVTEEIHREGTHGIIGQFFRSGIEIDVENQMLHLPGKSPVPVKLRPIWKFMAEEISEDPVCWTTVKPSNQGEGLIQGEYIDYEVYNLVSTGFKFGSNMNL